MVSGVQQGSHSFGMQMIAKGVTCSGKAKLVMSISLFVYWPCNHGHGILRLLVATWPDADSKSQNISEKHKFLKGKSTLKLSWF